MKSRVLAASMDLFCFYRGILLPERYAFCDLYCDCDLVKTTSFFVLRVSFSMFKLFRRDFEAILFGIGEIPLHFFIVIL